MFEGHVPALLYACECVCMCVCVCVCIMQFVCLADFAAAACMHFNLVIIR